MKRIRTAQIDIASRVATHESIQRQRQLGRIGEGFAWSGQRHVDSKTAGTTDADGVLLLRINIDQVLGLKNALLEVSGSEHASLLITSDQNLQQSVLDGVVLQNGEAGGNTNSIISAERSARGHEPLAIHNKGSERVLLEIDDDIVVLLHNHVHVALQAHSRLVLASYPITERNQTHRGKQPCG